MKLQVKKLDPKAKLPTYGTEYSAGADLYACTEASITIEPGKTCLIPTGLAIAVPQGYAGFVFARSGLASKRDLAPANKVGVIDADYRGPVMVAIHNHGQLPQTIEPHERIAQLVIMPVLTPEMELVDDLDETARGAGGFGSTGRK